MMTDSTTPFTWFKEQNNNDHDDTLRGDAGSWGEHDHDYFGGWGESDDLMTKENKPKMQSRPRPCPRPWRNWNKC